MAVSYDALLVGVDECDPTGLLSVALTGVDVDGLIESLLTELEDLAGDDVEELSAAVRFFYFFVRLVLFLARPNFSLLVANMIFCRRVCSVNMHKTLLRSPTNSCSGGGEALVSCHLFNRSFNDRRKYPFPTHT